MRFAKVKCPVPPIMRAHYLLALYWLAGLLAYGSYIVLWTVLVHSLPRLA